MKLMTTENESEWEYAGFWVRAWAQLIDNFLIIAITTLIMIAVYGVDYYETTLYGDWFLEPIEPSLMESLIGYVFPAGARELLIDVVFPALAVILFWVYRQATPGKMVIHAKIVDAQTGERATTRQCVGRYFAYIPAVLFFGLGFLWIAFDKKKQGWHDKLAGTVVIKKKGTELVKFKA